MVGAVVIGKREEKTSAGKSIERESRRAEETREAMNI
jgi:hypothetical protein